VATSDHTREDDGSADEPSQTCILVRFRAHSRVIEVRDHEEVVIGRSSGATFVADDERVSRRHVRIVFREGALWASDLGSRNGTTLNRRRLDGERSLSPGDELAVGPVRVSVCGPRNAAPIASEDELWTRLQAEVERALRFSRPLSLIGLRCSKPAALAAAARLGRLDRMGEYAPGSYLVVLPETELEAANRLAGELLETARAAGAEATARAVAVPQHGRAASALVAAALRGEETTVGGGGELVAVEPAMREMLELARRAAHSDATVLLSGETGSGKEVIAAEIHRRSARAHKPYVRINCASLPAALLESELFGHERGAFTGAQKRRVGFLETAHEGTLLLDEIGELPLDMQGKLLRVLEDKKLTRVGGEEELAVDVRFLAATHRDLDAEVAAGRFRQDLFFRINAITLKVPPLRERPQDLPILAQSFLDRVSGPRALKLSPAFLEALARYPWPGNVRELRNVIERAVVLSDGDELSPEQLPHRLSVLGPAPMREQVDELEKRNLVEALRSTGGNRTHAAQRLKISRRSLLYKLKKYGID
jgi:DNA-binding NtrC family response regulator/pSer/pThr/pTyr-binding forkhead associated (FHA) protein